MGNNFTLVSNNNSCSGVSLLKLICVCSKYEQNMRHYMAQRINTTVYTLFFIWIGKEEKFMREWSNTLYLSEAYMVENRKRQLQCL